MKIVIRIIAQACKKGRHMPAGKPMTFVYEGQSTVQTHSKDRQAYITLREDAKRPKEITYMTPIELMGASVAICTISIVLRIAKKMGIALERIHIDYEMKLNEKAQIIKIILHFSSPFTADKDTLDKLEKAWHRCPLHRSLDPKIDLDYTFSWGTQI